MKQPRSPTTQLLARDSSRFERVRTSEEDRTKTLDVKACRACGAGILENDNFCRWCGAPQDSGLTVNRRSQINLTSVHQISPPDGTRFLISPYHRVSGPVVMAIAENVSANLTSQRYDRFVQRVIQALVSLPIWLMFVLLSPFDAYAAAKNLTKGA